MYKSGNVDYNILYTAYQTNCHFSRGEKQMNKVWTEEEKQFISNNANMMTDKVLSAKLSQITGRNVTLQAVRKQRQKMGIAKQPGRGICAVVEKECCEETCNQSGCTKD
tara:strand:+ start:8861 stop:9187 length:327 start_codon:yes stop_codon:yes gene_type:complete